MVCIVHTCAQDNSVTGALEEKCLMQKILVENLIFNYYIYVNLVRTLFEVFWVPKTG